MATWPEEWQADFAEHEAIMAIDASHPYVPAIGEAFRDVVRVAGLLRCDLNDVWASSESSFAPFVIFVVRFTHRVAYQIDDMPIDNFLG